MGHYDLLQKHKRQKMGMFWENGEILAALFKNSILIWFLESWNQLYIYFKWPFFLDFVVFIIYLFGCVSS